MDGVGEAWYDGPMKPTVTAIVVAYNSRKYIDMALTGLLSQRVRPDTIVVVFCGNADGCMEYVQQQYPSVQVVNPQKNLGFAGGNNLAMRQFPADLFLLHNPDVHMDEQWLQEALGVAEGNKDVAAVVGMLYRSEPETAHATRIIDSTGLCMRTSGRPYDRGQGEVDAGQFASGTVWGFSGALVLLRAAALEQVAHRMGVSQPEYFDEFFHTYWEDADLSWRLHRAGYVTWFTPNATAVHARGIRGVEKKQFWLIRYLRNYYAIAPVIRKNIVANYFFTVIKNAPRLHWSMCVRGTTLVLFVVFCDVRAWPALGRVVRLFPRMWARRRESEVVCA